MVYCFKELEEIETTASKLLKEKLLQGTSIDALTASRQDEVKLKALQVVQFPVKCSYNWSSSFWY